MKVKTKVKSGSSYAVGSILIYVCPSINGPSNKHARHLANQLQSQGCRARLSTSAPEKLLGAPVFAGDCAGQGETDRHTWHSMTHRARGDLATTTGNR